MNPSMPWLPWKSLNNSYVPKLGRIDQKIEQYRLRQDNSQIGLRSFQAAFFLGFRADA